MSHPIQLRRRARQRAKRRRWERDHGWADSSHPREKGSRSWWCEITLALNGNVCEESINAALDAAYPDGLPTPPIGPSRPSVGFVP